MRDSQPCRRRARPDRFLRINTEADSVRCFSHLPDEPVKVVVQDRRSEHDGVKDPADRPIKNQGSDQTESTVGRDQSEVQQNHSATENIAHETTEMRADDDAAAVEQPDDRQVLNVMANIEQGNPQQQIVNGSHHKPPQPDRCDQHPKLQ